MGKPFLQAYAENMWAAGILRYYAGLADKIGGKTIPIGLFVCLFVCYSNRIELVVRWVDCLLT